MKILAAILGFLLVAPVAVAHSNGAEAKHPEYRWSTKLGVFADLNRNGVRDHAALGVGSNSVGLLVRVDSKQLPIIEIPIDGSKEFGICPGSAPTISVFPQSEAPLHALGAMPRGYKPCATCIEIVVGGGACDSIHFYWDATTGGLAWWRA